jgi:hypothetical protein
MSATGRGTNRDPKDFYATPRPAFAPLIPHLPRNVQFWEPCAGDGRLIQMLRESGRDNAYGSDLFPQSDDGKLYLPQPVNYLEDKAQRDFVVTNPPFSVAFEMCQHARTHSREFMFLLRLAFLESEERGDWMSDNEPAGLWVLRKRPSFVMSITCKTFHPSKYDPAIPGSTTPHTCKHNWLLPIESPRPKICPKCGGDKLSISTSDNSGYAWMYWAHDPRPELCGIHHI